MNAINFIGIGLSFFLSSLLVLKEKKGMFDYLLMAWLVLNGANLFLFYLNFTFQTDQFIPVLIAMGLIPYIVSPLLFIYVSSLIQGDRFSWRKQCIHLLPYSLMVVSMWVYWTSMTWEITPGFILAEDIFSFYIRNWSLLMTLSGFAYPLLCFNLFDCAT